MDIECSKSLKLLCVGLVERAENSALASFSAVKGWSPNGCVGSQQDVTERGRVEEGWVGCS